MNGKCNHCGEWDIDDAHDCKARVWSVSADHPVFARVVKFRLTEQESAELVSELESFNYENIERAIKPCTSHSQTNK
ncbi:hypothetical protein GCM10023116_43260 [Kistimonas scapharcae]|uniref:Uncharacterized protein n=1 Tax=Kistimonas scapharcae TaxID=1036133 RepID=A0ABP8V8B5_9GAMM